MDFIIYCRKITYKVFRIQSGDSIICGFYGIFFIEYTIAGKTLLAYTNLFSPNDSLKNKKIYKSTLKTNITKKNVSLDFRLKKIDETMNYFLEEIKHIKSVQNFKLL